MQRPCPAKFKALTPEDIFVIERGQFKASSMKFMQLIPKNASIDQAVIDELDEKGSYTFNQAATFAFQLPKLSFIQYNCWPNYTSEIIPPKPDFTRKNKLTKHLREGILSLLGVDHEDEHYIVNMPDTALDFKLRYDRIKSLDVINCKSPLPLQTLTGVTLKASLTITIRKAGNDHQLFADLILTDIDIVASGIEETPPWVPYG